MSDVVVGVPTGLEGKCGDLGKGKLFILLYLPQLACTILVFNAHCEHRSSLLFPKI